MKKFLALLLSLVLSVCAMVSFTACGGVELKIVNVKLTDENYAFVIKQGNTELKEEMDQFLATIKANGTFDTLVAKYFEGKGTKVGYTIDSANTANTADNFVVATNCPFEPFEYIGDDGKIYGLDIEIAAAFAESKGLTLVVKNIPIFDDIFSQVDAGYADAGMAGITVSTDREALYDFTSTYYAASQKLIVLADNTDFDGLTTAAEVEAKLATLTGKKIGYQNGTTGMMYIEGDADWGYTGFANIEGKGYASAQDAAMDLQNGNIYAVVVDEAPANAIVTAING